MQGEVEGQYATCSLLLLHAVQRDSSRYHKGVTTRPSWNMYFYNVPILLAVTILQPIGQNYRDLLRSQSKVDVLYIDTFLSALTSCRI